MKQMAFKFTIDQMLARTKTVTRRVDNSGYWRRSLKVGDIIRAVDQVQWLKPGQRPRLLGYIQVRSLTMDRLDTISSGDVRKEGFPNMTPEKFVAMFCKHMGAEPEWNVLRIEFEHVRKPRGAT